MVLFIIVARCGNIYRARQIVQINEIQIHNDLYKMPINPMMTNSLIGDENINSETKRKDNN